MAKVSPFRTKVGRMSRSRLNPHQPRSEAEYRVNRTALHSGSSVVFTLPLKLVLPLPPSSSPHPGAGSANNPAATTAINLITRFITTNPRISK